MSAMGVSSATRLTTSLSAKTVHMFEIFTSRFHSRPTRQNSSIESSMARAVASRKRPVPAAHLSFMTKLSTPPASSRWMTLESCPPMSMTVRASGARKCAPRAWQVISVMAESMSGMASRP